jgi:hypothetical protein
MLVKATICLEEKALSLEDTDFPTFALLSLQHSILSSSPLISGQ